MPLVDKKSNRANNMCAAGIQVQELGHLKDVLVLSVQGTRPEADRSSGGRSRL
jgi:hypothetical protein